MPWGHSVLDLLRRVQEVQALEELEELESRAYLLDRHYLGTGYPNAYPSGAATDCHDERTAVKRVSRRAVPAASESGQDRFIRHPGQVCYILVVAPGSRS